MVQQYIGTKAHMKFSLKHLQYAHNKAPNKYLIETEGCIDSEVPFGKMMHGIGQKKLPIGDGTGHLKNEKYLHPKYAPVQQVCARYYWMSE